MEHAKYFYINGEWVAPSTDDTLDVINPATGEVAARVPLASAAETASAISVAHAVFPAWRDTPPLRRAAVLFRFKELLEVGDLFGPGLLGTEIRDSCRATTGPMTPIKVEVVVVISQI